jgi:hypothetical protein
LRVAGDAGVRTRRGSPFVLDQTTEFPYILMQGVVHLKTFEKDAAEAGLSEDELKDIESAIAADPELGEVMQGTGGCRKARFAKKGTGKSTGKSGGYRVITWFGGEDIPVFLFNVFAKGDKVNLTKAECNELQKITATIGEKYRESVRKGAQGIRDEQSRRAHVTGRERGRGIRRRRGR